MPNLENQFGEILEKRLRILKGIWEIRLTFHKNFERISEKKLGRFPKQFGIKRISRIISGNRHSHELPFTLPMPPAAGASCAPLPQTGAGCPPP